MRVVVEVDRNNFFGLRSLLPFCINIATSLSFYLQFASSYSSILVYYISYTCNKNVGIKNDALGELTILLKARPLTSNRRLAHPPSLDYHNRQGRYLDHLCLLAMPLLRHQSRPRRSRVRSLVSILVQQTQLSPSWKASSRA